MARKYVIGVDLGGTKIATGLTDLTGALITREIIPTLASEGVDVVLSRIKQTIYQVMKNANVAVDEVVGIGIACPGPMNPDTGAVILAPNLGWRNVPIVDYIVTEFGLPTYLENDANAAALAEKWFGAGRDVDSLLYITVSTGIGGGLILNGEIYRGKHYMAGEIGHTIVMPDGGPLCGCGQQGCLEAIASGTAIANRVKDALRAGRDSLISGLVASIEDVNTKIVAEAALAGDPLATEVLERALLYLGVYIISMLNTLNVDKVIIGGGVSKLGDQMFNLLHKIIQEKMADVPAKKIPIVPAETGDNVGLLGAIGVVLNSHGE